MYAQPIVSSASIIIKAKTLGFKIKGFIALVLFGYLLYNLLTSPEYLYNFKADLAVTIIAFLIFLMNIYFWWYNGKKTEIILSPTGSKFFDHTFEWYEVSDLSIEHGNRTVYLILTLQKKILGRVGEPIIIKESVAHLEKTAGEIKKLFEQYRNQYSTFNNL